ncbi:MAG: bifunctional phosphoglucose/phosphomannose isomerase [Candidatus Heimdallarchaeota archaeon]
MDDLKDHILDNKEKLKVIDSESQFKVMSRWPELFEGVVQRTEQLTIPKNIRFGSRTLNYEQDFKNILICGMGGSAIGGAYIQAYAREALDIPILVSRKHHPPNFVGSSTLAIVCSYSGNTEETMQSFLDLIQRGVPVVAISSGGMLTEYCENLGIPIARVESGYRPRASLPLLFPPIFVFISRIIGKFDYRSDVDEAISIIRDLKDQIGPSSGQIRNPAKQAASSIAGTIPMVCSSIGCLAYRMRCQLNENAKLPAIDLEFPELGHNHIMGFESHPRNLSPLSLIILTLNSEKKDIRIRMDYLKELALNKGVPVCSYEAQGHQKLAQMLSLTYFGDYVSLYTSVLQGVDPSPTTTIDKMKLKLNHENPWKKGTETVFRTLKNDC